jgi:hypothetical protein
MKIQRCYKLEDGRILFASKGLGSRFMTLYKREMTDHSKHRFKSKWLPERMNFDAAQSDLDVFARLKRLEGIDLDVEKPDR